MVGMKRHRLLHRIFIIITLVLLFMLFSPGASLSQSTGDTQDGMVDESLPADIIAKNNLSVCLDTNTSFSFSTSHGSEMLPINVSNPTNTSIDVYIAIFGHNQWNIVDKLGTMKPGESQTFNYQVNFSYNGRTTETDQFAVIAKTPQGHIGSIFSVHENWSQYEKSLKSSLSFFGVISAGTLLGILIIILAGVLVVASHTKHEEQIAPGEYTLKTLFIPVTRMRPMAEKIADIIINPFFWLLELLGGAILILLILTFALMDIRPDIGFLVFIIGGVAALFMPTVFLVIGWLADYYEREPLRFIMAMFMWGVLATLFAFFINTASSLVIGTALGNGAALLITAVVVAPIVEETAKGTGLIIISGHHEFDDTFDGILYGFAIGMGFAAVENWLYFATNANPVAVGGLVEWTDNILYRSFLGSLAHGCFTAATGGMIGYIKSRGVKNYAIVGFLLGLPMAMVLHATFNFTAILDSIVQTAFGIPVPLFDPLLTIGVTAIYIFLGVYLQLRIKARLKAQPKA